MTTEELDQLCHDFIIKHGATPAPLNYKGFPKSICTSINHVVCHGIPGDKKLLDGDILNIDVTVILDGWHGDTSRMYGVGDKIPVKAKNLMEVTYDSLMKGIEVVRPGATLGISARPFRNMRKVSVFQLCAIFAVMVLGRVFHSPPSVVHYGEPGMGMKLEPGMFFTIEPMINAGGYATKTLPDGWTAVTRDRSLSAQYEHSLAVTDDGFEIFTNSPKGYTKWPYL